MEFFFSSFLQDKIIGLLSKANPNQENQADDGTPWYLKYGSRALGIIGAGCTWQKFTFFIVFKQNAASSMISERKKKNWAKSLE